MRRSVSLHQPTLGDLFAQAIGRNSDGVAIIDGERRYTYTMLADRVGRLLALFEARGYGPGYRIALGLPMGFDFLSWYIAVQIGGLTSCDLPPSMPITDLRQRVATARFKTVVFAPDAFAGKIDDMAAAFDAHMFATTPIDGLEHLAPILEALDPLPVRCRPPSDHATIVFTGGSTGLPKAEGFSGQSQGALAITILATVPFPNRPVTVAYRTGSTVMQLGLNQTFMRGGTVVTIPDFDLEVILDAARVHGANNFYLASRTIATLADQPGIESMQGKIQLIFHGGEPLAPAQFRKAIDKLGAIFVASYGSSESGGSSAYLLPADLDPARPERLMSAGRALPGVQIEIRDEEGLALPIGAIGEVAIRSPGQMDCYLDEPGKTAEAIRDGWVYTGDVGRLDRDGFLTIIDRTAFAVKSEGQTVYPRLVDAHLSEHPAVSMAVTLPLADPLSDNRICAAVTLRKGMTASEDELLSFLAGRPEMPKVHHVVIFSHLPQVAGNLKIDRAKVRTALEAALLERAL
jgi:fatty-acyl-CoA synthase